MKLMWTTTVSVLSPFTKILERIMFDQIKEYFETESLFSNYQHGFRESHSTQTALHSVISSMRRTLNEKKIGLYLFIDFRKAFDHVNSELLIHKLSKYGFTNGALNLISSYFNKRTQITIYDNCMSDPIDLNLGVPQGSVLGPLLFLIFINDLPSYLNDTNSTLFADDTTIYQSSHNFDDVLINFNNSMDKLLQWCMHNKLVINWKKTFAMIITKKRIRRPKFILVKDHRVEVVSSFKLLGVVIDDKLNFIEYSKTLKSNILKKLFSLKRLYFLPHSVKILFFKSFLLPMFDYSSTLTIYFSKIALQCIVNCYNFCIFKLLNLDFVIADSEDYN